MNSTANYQRLNNITGWLVFLIASFTYLSTIESTASFWDCGEYIACAYKLEVGHPPGAPLFLLIGRFFSLFAFGDTSKVGMMVNAMSAICSAFTILFLFWTITALARKIMDKTGELTQGKMYAVLGAGAVGALAYTFSDSFWFSAVEGEVYAMSSFFTAISFWAILRWEREAEDPHSHRWLILIAYLIGLAVGVHLLNLLVIPAVVYIYYFKKYQNVTRKGFIITGIVSIAILGGIQGGVIPMIVKLAAWFELKAVNGLGLPFNSGTIIYGVLLIGGIVWGLHYTSKKVKPVLNTVILCFTVILIGYSSFLVLVIRSQANPPMDENNPENAVNLLSYLNREQYGTWPLLYGQYFCAPNDPQRPYLDGNPVYGQDEKTGKYVVIDDRKNTIANYDPKFCTIFPRMWSSQSNHVAGYKQWTDPSKYQKVAGMDSQTGEQTMIAKPTFSQNLGFFFRYQVGQMYSRYFLWNFVGRQNDIQGYGNSTDGNWITGIPFIDEARLGPQEGLPDSADNNKAKNALYGLPFILGLLGIWYQFKKDNKNATVVGFLFLLTGIAIVIYLNQKPFEPRERDYAYAGSFYAYSIWIGLGVLAIFDFLQRKANQVTSAVTASVVCLLAVPAIMAKEEWNDHDRSGRYIARDFARNYLESCAPNAILFTNGDNDTFPLWYAQEVEGIRTDVRVVCLELLNTDWCIDQLVHKAYDSDPLPISFTKEQYHQGVREVVLFHDRKIQGYIPVKDLIEFSKSERREDKLEMASGSFYNYFPTKNVSVPVDSATVVNNGTVPKELAGRIVKSIDWTLTGSWVQKNDLMILDILAHNNWKRPIYFAATAPASSYLNLAPYLQLEGLAYRLVPVKQNEQESQQETRIATEIMYKNIMDEKKFQWGGMDKPDMYLDNVFLQSCALNMRQRMGALATALAGEGKKDKAVKVLDKCVAITPEYNVPYDGTMFSIVLGYYQADAFEKANTIAKKVFDNAAKNIDYFYSFRGKERAEFGSDVERAQETIERLVYFTDMFKQTALNKEFTARYNDMMQKYQMESVFQKRR
ncbi:MAG: formate-dependent nitrite reductase, rane component [Bacteroidetes bacterium]|nr:formate-dependent nitrite reductase, rane component [Bacteroidota bacterium]